MNPHARHPASFLEMFASFWRNRSLIWQMTKRDVVGRYRGSIMGIAWSFFNPLLMLVVYTFVFSVVFKARWGVDGEESRADFAVLLFVGMIVHGLFAECVNRSPGLILSNANYVKKVVFPLETLIWVAMGSALFHAAIGSFVLVVAQLFMNMYVPWTIVFFPLIVIPLVVITTGVSWFVAATGVFIRDIGQITGILTIALMFVAPVFYPIAALPQEYQWLLFLNPLTFVIEQGREVLVWGRMPDWIGLSVYFAVAVLVGWFGFWWFQRTRKGFADVL